MADVTTTTGLTGSGGGNMIRITGMASGLDVDALVKKMLTADQIKIDTASKNNQTVQWKKDAYTSIIAGIKDLQSSFFDVTSSSTSVLSDTAYSAFNVTGIPVDGVISTAASISADATAQAGTYSISFKNPTVPTPVGEKAIGNIAIASNITGLTKLMTTAAKPLAATNATKLSDIGFLMGHSITLSYDNNDGTGLQNKTITFDKDTTLGGLADMINTETKNGVTARFSELTGKLSIQTSSTGKLSTLNITSDAGVLSKLNLTNDANAISLVGASDDAHAWITPPGGVATYVTQASNNFTIDGISYNLTTGEDSKFSVVADSQKVYDKISGFIDKYNGLVGQIQTAVDAKTNSDYPPLTAAQQTSMSATDIANWNIKAQVGSLSNDKNLTKMLSDMRSAFVSVVDSTGLTFGKYGTNSIGLDTSTDVTQGGKITIASKTLLMNAITNHPDLIKKMFTNISTATDSTTKFNEQGIFTRISDIITKNVGMIGTSYNTATLTQFANVQDNYSTTGGVGKNTLPDQLFYQQQLITQLNKNMAADQTKYYNQFSALEVAMSNMTAQMSMLSTYSTS